MRMKKRGISEVVSSVLIILISIVAVVLIAAVIIPMVKDQLSKSQECLGASLGNLGIMQDMTCWNQTSSNLTVGISYSGGDSNIVSVVVSVGKNLGMNAAGNPTCDTTYSSAPCTSSVRTVAAPAAGGYQLYDFKLTAKPAKVTITPIIYAANEKKYKTCQMAGEFDISAC